MPGYTALSLAVHALVIALIAAYASYKAREPAKKEVEVSFVGPGKGKGAPPPPPPPAAKKRSNPTPKRTLKPILSKVEIPKPVIVPPDPPKDDPPPDDDSADDDGVEGGVEGGVAGGVVGGVIGGQVGGTGGGGTMVPTPPEKPKAKNVPPFVIARDMIRQGKPRLSEMFRATHHAGEQISGLYRVCVDTDGHVYEVTPVKGISGADEEIVEGIKAEWLYKPQSVPVCFAYNLVITLQQ